MELRHLQALIAAAEELSFTRAAGRLFTTQPSLSRTIRELERELGIQLFDRTTTPLTLTRAGEVYTSDVRRLLEMLDRAGDRARHANDHEPAVLDIGYVEHLPFHLLPSVVKDYRRRVPDTEVVLHMMTAAALERRLVDGSIDIGFCWNRRAPVQKERLGEYLNVALLPPDHPLTARDVLTPQDFHDELIVTLSEEEDPSCQAWLRHEWSGTGGVPRIVQMVPRLGDAIGVVAAGFGAALIPAHALRGLDTSRVEVRVFDPPVKSYLRMVWNTAPGLMAVETFVELVRQHVRGAPRSDFFVPDARIVDGPTPRSAVPTAPASDHHGDIAT